MRAKSGHHSAGRALRIKPPQKELADPSTASRVSGVSDTRPPIWRRSIWRWSRNRPPTPVWPI